MLIDEIVEEVRAFRDAYAKKFDYDVQAIYQDLKEEEIRSGRKVVFLPPKRLPLQESAGPSRKGQPR